MVQKRQLRKYHEDAHYASALFRYQKEKPFYIVSLDDKHKIPVGEPGYPVASVKRGKKVLVGIDRAFEVGDHDFTHCSLTPSVTLVISIPDLIEGSFYRGRVCVGVKDSIFEPSSPHRHATKLNSLLKFLSFKKKKKKKAWLPGHFEVICRTRNRKLKGGCHQKMAKIICTQ